MTRSSIRRRAAGCSLAVASAALVAGCSVLGGGSSAPSRAASAPVQTSGPSATGSTGASPSPSPTASPTASDTVATDPSASGTSRPALASRSFTVKGTYAPQVSVTMRFAVVELRRRGELLDLTAELTNAAPDRSQDLRWQVAQRFAGSYRQDLANTDGAFSGAVLTDVAGKKRYLVAADSGSACVCTVQLSSTFVGAGQTIELSATYAAPPASTTKLDVTVASLGTFRDLPVT